MINDICYKTKNKMSHRSRLKLSLFNKSGQYFPIYSTKIVKKNRRNSYNLKRRRENREKRIHGKEYKFSSYVLKEVIKKEERRHVFL